MVVVVVCDDGKSCAKVGPHCQPVQGKSDGLCLPNGAEMCSLWKGQLEG